QRSRPDVEQVVLAFMTTPDAVEVHPDVPPAWRPTPWNSVRMVRIIEDPRGPSSTRLNRPRRLDAVGLVGPFGKEKRSSRRRNEEPIDASAFGGGVQRSRHLRLQGAGPDR